MGQGSSLLPHQGDVIDIKRQAAATDLIGLGVWYFCPASGRNVWANRAALQMYSLSGEAFCHPQQEAWQAAAGDAGAESWQRSNLQLLEGLAGKKTASAPSRLQAGDVTVHIANKSGAGASAASGSSTSCTVHAGFLPLPASIAGMSARLLACVVLHKKKLMPAYLVQVTAVQHIAKPGANGLTSSVAGGVSTTARASVLATGRQLAELQMVLARQFSEPVMLDARSGLPSKQQDLVQEAAAAGSCTSSGSCAAHMLRVDEAAADVSAGGKSWQPQSRLVQQSSSSICGVSAVVPAVSGRLGLVSAQHMRSLSSSSSFDGCSNAQSSVQAAATSLRMSFERQTPVGTAAVSNSDRTRSLGASKQAPTSLRTHSSTTGSCEGQSVCNADKQHASCGGQVNRGNSLHSSFRQGSSAAAGMPGPVCMRKDSNNLSVVLQQTTPEDVAARQLRLTEMCDNHAMFQFLFDAQGKLLCANKRAMNNMREHLGEHDTYTLPQYLSIGQCDGGLSAEQIFAVITSAIFINQEPCFRLPQLRYSKRRPGKCRWVLYEVWAMDDPVTGEPALLVTEQNITQVKLVEEQYSSQMRQLETQLEEALIQQQHAEAAAAAAEAAAAEVAAAVAATKDGEPSQCSLHYPQPAIDTCSAADKTLQLLDKLLQGHPVSVEDAEILREALLTGSSNLHAPLYLDEQVLQHTQALKYTPEVGANLLQMLSNRAWGDEADSHGKEQLNLLDYDEGDSSLTADTDMVNSTDSSSFTQQLAASLQSPQQLPAAAAVMSSDARTNSSTGGGDCAAANSAGVAAAGTAAAAAAAATKAMERSKGQAHMCTDAASRQQQQQPLPVSPQQHRASVSSAYPVVTAESFQAAGPATGCGACIPAAASAASTTVANGMAGSAVPVHCSGNSVTRTSLNAAAKAVLSLTASPSLELEKALARADDWQFDSFELTTVTGNRPLSVLAFYLIKKANLVQKCGLDETRLARWLVRVEDGYPPNPYHNRSHAADVTRNVHLLMTRGGVGAAVAGGWGGAEDIAVLAVYLAAVMHDFEHRGVNNDFLVRSCDALALLYNDRSPHENHHLAASWGLLVEHNFLRGMPHKNKELLRRLTIEMVLATDMKQHFAIHGMFQSKIHLLAALSTQRSGVPTGSMNSGALPQLVTAPSGLSPIVVKASGGSRADSPSVSASPSRHHMQLVTSSTLSSSSFSGCLPSGAARSGSLTGVPEGTPAAAAEPGGAAAAGNAATGAYSSSCASGPVPPAANSAGGSFVMARLRSSSSMMRRGGLAGSSTTEAQGVWEEDTETRSLYLQMALKASDLGHLCAAREVHKKWVSALEEENFRQGDRERAAGLPVSPLMDRTKQGITKSQVGFFDIVALPLFTSLAQRFPGASPMLDAVLDNYAMWAAQEREGQKQG